MGVKPMNQTITNYKQLFPNTHEKVKSIIADENTGSRDLDELEHKIVCEKNLEGIDVERIKKIAEKRIIHFNDIEADKVRKTAKNHMDNFLNGGDK